MTTIWTSADGRSFRVLFARIPVPPSARGAAMTPSVLVAFAYALTQSRQILKNELQIFVAALFVGAIAWGLLGVWIARGASWRRRRAWRRRRTASALAR